MLTVRKVREEVRLDNIDHSFLDFERKMVKKCNKYTGVFTTFYNKTVQGQCATTCPIQHERSEERFKKMRCSKKLKFNTENSDTQNMVVQIELRSLPLPLPSRVYSRQLPKP